jgi:hypothetical protein
VRAASAPSERAAPLIAPREIARMLAERIEQLVLDLLPKGHREGHEWRVGSVAGEAGHSLGVHLAGNKAGVWCDFSGSGDSGDALDLVCSVLGVDVGPALAWSRRWLGLDDDEVGLPSQRAAPSITTEPLPDPDRWRYPWQRARPIARTLAEAYLARRGLCFDDPESRVLRFAARRARQSPTGELEYHPALLAALSDVHTGEQVGILNIYLRPDGCDRVRDRKGKTVTGRAKSAAVMLAPFDEPTYGLTICEGAETGIALLMAGLSPVWACGGAGLLRWLPVLGGLECLTVAADADEPGELGAAAVMARWREAGREVVIIAPPSGDWADRRKVA